MASQVATKADAADKISTLIMNHKNSTHGSAPFVSIEFFPPRTEVGIESLWKVLTKLTLVPTGESPSPIPLFADFTWGAGGSTSDLTLDLCKKAKTEYNTNPNMHITCTNVDRNTIDEALTTCKEAGITNILALRGDPPVGQEVWTATEGGFTCARDLVKHIRNTHGDFFHITVAGYPEGHPNKMSLVTDGYDSLSEAEKGRCSFEIDEQGNEKIYVCKDADYQLEMEYLQSKIEAGADCIITQMFFDCKVFDTFVANCRAAGIKIPIVPGIMCVSNYGGFKRMTTTCKTRVTKELLARVEAAKAADEDEGKGETFKKFGIQLGTEMSKHLIASKVDGLHYYTLNSSVATLEIVNAVGLSRSIA